MYCSKQVADFGKSLILSPTGVARTSSYATITHMAPEVLSSCSHSRAADVYSFGVLLWQMSTGRSDSKLL